MWMINGHDWRALSARLWPCCMVLGALLCGCGGPQGERLDTASVELNNLGVAQMGRFDYAEAVATFKRLVQQAPAWLDGQVNLAIATLNRQQMGDEVAALALIDAVLTQAPDHLRAHYVAAILHFNAGRIAQAEDHFMSVAEADPTDAYALYFLAQCHLQLGQVESALTRFEQAVSADPYLRSAHYGRFLAQQRLGQEQAARASLRSYQRLERNPRSRLAEIKYTRMGSRAMALAVRPVQAQRPAPALVHQLFSSAQTIAATLEPHSSAVALIDGQHRWILVFAPATRLRLYDVQAGAWLGPQQLPFLATTDVTAAAFGDMDNDGQADLYLARRGPNQLWRQGERAWLDVSEAWGVENGAAEARDVLLVDADHDGDLDILLANVGADELLNNNGNGSFTAIAQAQGIAGDERATRQLLAVDLDHDRDTDLIFIHQQPPHRVYLNDRLWNYRPAASAFDAFKASDIRAVAALDEDVDGQVSLFSVDTSGTLSRWQAAVSSIWTAQPASRLSDLPSAGVSAQDLNGDGRAELVLWGARGWSVLDLSRDYTPASGVGRFLTLFNQSQERGPSLISTQGSNLLIHSPDAGRHAFVSLDFSGRAEASQSMRSNASGVGTHYVIRAEHLWVAGSTLRTGSGPGMSLQPQSIGLGGVDRIVAIEIEWSDGVLQTEIGLTAGRLHRLEETQRQLASCPVLFTWDGDRFRFVSDLLGVAGLGFNTGRGQYATARPWERFLLPSTALRPADNKMVLKITEPMEEIAYIDQVILWAYDHPAEVALALDERMATAAPQPSGEVFAYSDVLLPQMAVDAAGDDVLAALSVVDQLAAPIPATEPQWLGLLQSEQVLTLSFDHDLAALQQPYLLLDGWVEYGYSQTAFAAWQAGRSYDALSLEVQDRLGQWHSIASHFGYPAGMPRQAALPLPVLPPGSSRLRLRTHQQIYLDRVAVAAVVKAEIKPQRLPLSLARVERVGFPKRSNGPQMRPQYDFQQRQPFWDTRYASGLYTAFGPARELVETRDNGLAIIGPGDALHMEFEHRLAAPPSGWRRAWVLEVHGWAKDMDLYTQSGDTVAPLPADQRLDRQAASRLHRRYNTRFQSGH